MWCHVRGEWTARFRLPLPPACVLDVIGMQDDATDHKRFTLRLPGDLYAEVVRVSKEHDRSINWVIRDALKSYVNKESK